MGCGASKVTPQNDEEAKPLHANGSKIEHNSRSNGHANGSITAAKLNEKIDPNNNQNITQLNGNINVKPLGNGAVVDSISNREVFDEQDINESQHFPTQGKWFELLPKLNTGDIFLAHNSSGFILRAILYFANNSIERIQIIDLLQFAVSMRI